MIMMMFDDEDKHCVMVEMMNGMMVRDHEDARQALRSIAGWGVVPRMAPPPSQGGSTLRGEREKDVKEREREREREMVIHVSFIPHKGLNSTRGGRYIGV